MDTSLKRRIENCEETMGDEIDKKRQKLDLNSEIMKIGFSGSVQDLENLSKRKRKKLLKSLKCKQIQPIRRKQEKEKKKMRRIYAKMNNLDLGPSRKLLKRCLMSTSACKITVAIDLSFDDLMDSKEMQSCMKQVNRCYCANRRVANPMQFHVTNFNGKSKEMMIKQESGYKNWDVNFHEESYLELFDKSKLVYLTSDSSNVIYDLDESKTYIIGGLVDHNRHKLVCYRLACEQDIEHARLPIGELLQMSTRKVLAINHVFEILLLVSSGKSWKDAFLEVIPQRKGAVAKDCGGENEMVGVGPVSIKEETSETALVKLEEEMVGVGSVSIKEETSETAPVKLEEEMVGVGSVSIKEETSETAPVKLEEEMVGVGSVSMKEEISKNALVKFIIYNS